MRPALLLASLLSLWAFPAHGAWPTSVYANLPVCTLPADQESPVLVSDGEGGALLAWTDGRGGDRDVYVQHLLSSGAIDPAWPANGRALCAAPGDQVFPQIVSDGAGGAIVTWSDGRDGVPALYAQRVRADGTCHPDWPVDGRAVAPSLGEDWDRRTVPDGAHGALVAWTAAGGGTLFAQHLLARGALDPAWPATGVPVSGASGSGWRVAMVEDGAGGAIVAWMDARAIETDIYAQRVLAGGVVDPAWPASGRRVCGAEQNQFDPVLVTDGAGGAIVGWWDLRRGTAHDVYARRVRGDGVPDPAWPADGRLVSSGCDEAADLALLADGAGGAFAAWSGSREGSDRLLVTHVLASGAADPRWPAGGVTVRAVTELLSAKPALVGDAHAGAIVVWTHFVDDQFDLYAHHVLEAGTLDPAWPAAGAPLSLAPETQGQHAPIADGTGGVIAAWMDARAGMSDRNIYAQRLGPQGSAGGTLGVDARAAATLRIERAWPNPARATLALSVVLTRDRPVEVEVFDLGGRRLVHRDVGSLPPGTHVVRVPLAGVVAPGVCVVRVTQGDERRETRVAVLR